MIPWEELVYIGEKLMKWLEPLLSTLLSALATVVAAFLGAWYAFKLMDKDHQRKKRATAVASGNRAIFTLMRQWNELNLIQRQLIDPIRSHPAKFVTLLPALSLDYEHLKFDVDSLSFLLDTEYRQCLMDLLIAEEKFQTAVRVLNERSRLHFQTVQPLLEKAGIIEGGDYTKQQIEVALGDRVKVELSRLTDDVIEHVDHAIISLKETSDKLHTVLKELYPKETIIDFKPIDNK